MTSAPDGLGLVHDLLNTIPVGSGTDLLDDLAAAQAWLKTALDNVGAGPIELDRRGLEALRALRTDLRQAVTASGNIGTQTAAVALRLNTDGAVHLEPRGDGGRRAAALVLIEAYQAQLTDTWRRLKTCRNPRCAVAFYDRSRNNSGVWHDVHTCGNAANLRASRARRRAVNP